MNLLIYSNFDYVCFFPKLKENLNFKFINYNLHNFTKIIFISSYVVGFWKNITRMWLSHLEKVKKLIDSKHNI